MEVKNMQGKFVLLPEWMIHKMNLIKKKNGYSLSVIIRLALNKYLKDNFDENLAEPEIATKDMQDI